MPSSTPKRASSTPPWERANPKSKKGLKHTTLSPAAESSAKRRAEAAGRPYPNLVDNMRAAHDSKAKAK